MKHILKNVTKQTDNKYINIYLAEYEIDGGIKNYQICSRKSQDNLQINHPDNIIVDAVRILPYYYENEKLKLCFIKEFRYAINNYIYSFPAGLVDMGESYDTAATRELYEEIGAKIKKLEFTDKACFSSAGISDESIVCYEAEVELTGNQKLDFSEDIELVIVDFDDLEDFLESHLMGLQTRLQAKYFYYKTLYKNLKGKKNE